MRISDWSSDVCSSDLVSPALDPQTRLVPALATLDNRGGEWRVGEPVTAAVQLTGSGGSGAIRVPTTAVQSFEGKSVVRSEEHTSELQSLMRISYAVFCLKKKKKTSTNQSTSTSIAATQTT